MDALADLTKEWMLTLGTVTDATRAVYERGVDQFRTWLGDAHPDLTDPAELTRRHIDQWMRHLVDEGRSEATRRVRLITIRKFLDYLVDEPDIGLTANPAAKVALPSPKVKEVPVIHDADLVRLLRPIEAGASFVDRRDAAILRVLIDTGCRRAELSGIDVGDVDLRSQEIVLRRTKGGHERTVPLGRKTALAIRKYLRARDRRAGAGRTSALFLTTREGDRPDGMRISGGGVHEMLGRRCRAAGLPVITPHAFRHTWCADLFANGANETDVEKLAGWRSPLMIRRYGASAASQRARDAARRLGRGDRV